MKFILSIFNKAIMLINAVSFSGDKKVLNSYAVWYYKYLARHEYFNNEYKYDYLCQLAKLVIYKERLIEKTRKYLPEFIRRPVEGKHFDVKKSIGSELLYARCFKSIYHLLSKYGDLQAAIEALELIKSASNVQSTKYRQKSEFMAKLLPDVLSVESKLRNQTIDDHTGAKNKLIISIMVWGDKYTDLFLNYCLPSLVGPGNLEKISDVDIYWHIFTSNKTKKSLLANKLFNSVSKNNHARFEIIPQEVIDSSEFINRYWMLGAYTQTSLIYAASIQAYVHFTNPDVVYSKDFFKNLFEISKRKSNIIILSSSFSTWEDSICRVLDEVKSKNGYIAISSKELHCLGLQHLHKIYHSCFIDPVKIREGPLPGLPLLVWREDNVLVMHIKFLNPMLVSYKVLDREMRLSYYTIDSEIIKLVNQINNSEVNIHVINEEDDIGFIEISSIKAEGIDKNISREKFIHKFKKNISNDELGIFSQELRLAVYPGCAHDLEISPHAVECKKEFDGLKSDIYKFLKQA